MYKEFEARSEEEAIDKAVAELGLKKGDFDVEVVSSQKKGLFRKGSVTIRVHVPQEEDVMEAAVVVDSNTIGQEQPFEVEDGDEVKIIEFVTTMINKMGYKATVKINFRRDRKLGLSIDSPSSSILIGRKGRNLDAIQLLANVYAGELDKDYKVIIDTENYRMRHEEQIIRMAFKNAEFVRRTHRSKLLPPMNPFERRLVHTALNDFNGVTTESEGEGLYKQVRILPSNEE